jgi:hypothetical protein
MYFLCGALMFLSALSAALVPDTKGRAMENQIRKSEKSPKQEVYKITNGRGVFHLHI